MYVDSATKETTAITDIMDSHKKVNDIVVYMEDFMIWFCLGQSQLKVVDWDVIVINNQLAMLITKKQ